MFSDNGPYSISVRVGKGFQADVPDWSGPINNDFDTIGEPLEMDPSEFVGFHELKFKKPLSKCCGPIGNWLQCREAIDDVGNGVSETTCGKWCRAPLFEVQTDDWKCWCAVIWDPVHADWCCTTASSRGTQVSSLSALTLQFQNIRRALHGESVVIMCKNTMMKRSIKIHFEPRSSAH